MLRRILFWLHLIAGVVCGVVILVMALTGVLLTYEKQILAWADRGTTPAGAEHLTPPGAPRLPFETLIQKGQAVTANGDRPTTLTFYSGSHHVAVASGARGGGGGGRGNNTVYIDSHTGDPLGAGSPQARAFFRSVTSWHRNLAASQEYRYLGTGATGAANLIFLFIVVSGLFIWWPGRARNFRQILWFRRGLPAKARNWNWHNVFGFWAAIPLFFIVLSGTVISYSWASNLVYRAAGVEPPVEGGQRQGEGQAPRQGQGRGSEGPGQRQETGAVAAQDQNQPTMARQTNDEGGQGGRGRGGLRNAEATNVESRNAGSKDGAQNTPSIATAQPQAEPTNSPSEQEGVGQREGRRQRRQRQGDDQGSEGRKAEDRRAEGQGSEAQRADARQGEGQPARNAATGEAQRQRGEQRPAESREAAPNTPSEVPQTEAAKLQGIDTALAKTEQESPDWKSIAVRVPTSADAPLTLNVDRGNGGQPQFKSTLTMDRAGTVTKKETFDDQNAGRRARSWLRYVHTGEYYGVLGQTVAGLASFAGVMLVWTGFALSWKRFWAWNERRKKVPAATAPGGAFDGTTEESPSC